MTEAPILLPSGASVALASPEPPEIALGAPAPATMIPAPSGPSSVAFTTPEPPQIAMAAAAPGSAAIFPTPGAPGSTGASGDNAPVIGETPQGVKNGVNNTFTTADNYAAGSLGVYRNGLRENRATGCYTEQLPNRFVLSTPPLSDDDLSVDYLIS